MLSSHRHLLRDSYSLYRDQTIKSILLACALDPQHKKTGQGDSQDSTAISRIIPAENMD